MKIFLLPKIATQSPRDARSTVSMSRDEVARAQFVDDVNHENACGTGVSCNLDNRRCSNFGYFSHRLEARCDVVAMRALPAPASPPQHFLKRDSVFFDVLVYSGCSAFRFPGARSDQVISLTHR
jgi:hypothetical protein